MKKGISALTGKILAVIMLGVTVLGETYILKFENLKYLHGVHYFADILIMAALPLITAALWINAIRTAKREELEEKNQEQMKSWKNHQAVLNRLISDNLPLKEYLESAGEQIGRFEKKTEKAKSLCAAAAESNCEATLETARVLFYSRVKELEDICDIFDSEEYKKFNSGLIKVNDPKLKEKKRKFFQDLKDSAAVIVSSNEDLIIKMDELIKTLYDGQNETSWNAASLIAVNELEDFVRQSKNSTEEQKYAHRKAAEDWRKTFSGSNF